MATNAGNNNTLAAMMAGMIGAMGQNNGATPPPANNGRGEKAPDGSGRWICHSFRDRQDCRFGNTCKFAHVLNGKVLNPTITVNTDDGPTKINLNVGPQEIPIKILTNVPKAATDVQLPLVERIKEALDGVCVDLLGMAQNGRGITARICEGSEMWVRVIEVTIMPDGSEQHLWRPTVCSLTNYNACNKVIRLMHENTLGADGKPIGAAVALQILEEIYAQLLKLGLKEQPFETVPEPVATPTAPVAPDLTALLTGLKDVLKENNRETQQLIEAKMTSLSIASGSGSSEGYGSANRMEALGFGVATQCSPSPATKGFGAGTFGPPRGTTAFHGPGMEKASFGGSLATKLFADEEPQYLTEDDMSMGDASSEGGTHRVAGRGKVAKDKKGKLQLKGRKVGLAAAKIGMRLMRKIPSPKTGEAAKPSLFAADTTNEKVLGLNANDFSAEQQALILQQNQIEREQALMNAQTAHIENRKVENMMKHEEQQKIALQIEQENLVRHQQQQELERKIEAQREELRQMQANIAAQREQAQQTMAAESIQAEQRAVANAREAQQAQQQAQMQAQQAEQQRQIIAQQQAHAQAVQEEKAGEARQGMEQQEVDRLKNEEAALQQQGDDNRVMMEKERLLKVLCALEADTTASMLRVGPSRQLQIDESSPLKDFPVYMRADPQRRVLKGKIGKHVRFESWACNVFPIQAFQHALALMPAVVGLWNSMQQPGQRYINIVYNHGIQYETVFKRTTQCALLSLCVGNRCHLDELFVTTLKHTPKLDKAYFPAYYEKAITDACPADVASGLVPPSQATASSQA